MKSLFFSNKKQIHIIVFGVASQSKTVLNLEEFPLILVAFDMNTNIQLIHDPIQKQGKSMLQK